MWVGSRFLHFQFTSSCIYKVLDTNASTVNEYRSHKNNVFDCKIEDSLCSENEYKTVMGLLNFNISLHCGITQP